MKEKKVNLQFSLQEYIFKNSDKYVVLEQYVNFLLIAKKIHVTVLELNENSIFQPLESKKEKDYFIVFYLKLGFNIPVETGNDIPVYKIREVNEIKKVLEEIK